MAEIVDFSPIKRASTKRPPPAWVPIIPVPADAPKPTLLGPKGEQPVATFTYYDGDSARLGFVMRFDRPDGSKDFRPLTYCEKTESGQRAWRFQLWQSPRPLYGLNRLAAAPSAPVLIVEGEKAADAATRLLPDWVSVTSPNGAKAAGAANWSTLRGRDVVIWPDHDAAGAEYAASVVKHLRAMGLRPRIVEPPADRPEGWDVGDAAKDGWTTAEVKALIDGSVDAINVAAADDESSEGGRRRTRDDLLGLLGDAELWHDESDRAFVSINIGGAWKNIAIQSYKFRTFLSGRFYDATGSAPSGQPLADACLALAAKAIHHSPKFSTWRRVGRDGDKVYVDLGGESWRAVEIDQHGWRIVDRAPIKFLRSEAMRSLPEPEPGGDIGQELRPFVNVVDDADFRLICAFLVHCLNPDGPFAILSVNGEQGSAKSTVCGFLRDLIDPNAGNLRSIPRDDRDLAVTAENNWVLAYDNVSGVPSWVSDALCRISTGSGFAGRMLHTDSDEIVMFARRPILLNGIPDLAGRPDLRDRSISILLPPIAAGDRKSEKSIKAEFEKARPVILGCLLDGLSAAMRPCEPIAPDRLPRMADFAELGYRAARGLGWSGEEFLDDYDRARREAVELVIEQSTLASAIRLLPDKGARPGDIEGIRIWRGTATELL